MVKIEFICRGLFVYFYKKLYRKACPINVSESTKAMVSYETFDELFKIKYSSSVGFDFLWTYALFQFGRYLDKIENGLVGFSGEITPSMIFGKKAFDVFNSRRIDRDFITKQNPLITKYKVSIDEWKTVSGLVEKKKVSKEEVVDNIKQIAVRFDDPLTTCIDMTDLWNPLDRACKKCIDREECKKALEEIYPKIYKERSTL